jgi:PD-(D/E)XK endonuclease
MDSERWTPRRQGDIGEVSALAWLIAVGASVSIPFGHSPDYDLLADFGDRIDRVQVKTSNSFHQGRYVVALCTRGGNQSWNRIVKRLDATRCDQLFAHVGDGRRWFIPASELGGGTAIHLGGPKYAQYEIDAGEALPARLSSLD